MSEYIVRTNRPDVRLFRLLLLRFFSKFLIQRNTVENIFKPNILQTLLGRRRRDIRGDILEQLRLSPGEGQVCTGGVSRDQDRD